MSPSGPERFLCITMEKWKKMVLRWRHSIPGCEEAPASGCKDAPAQTFTHCLSARLVNPARLLNHWKLPPVPTTCQAGEGKLQGGEGKLQGTRPHLYKRGLSLKKVRPHMLDTTSLLLWAIPMNPQTPTHPPPHTPRSGH